MSSAIEQSHVAASFIRWDGSNEADIADFLSPTECVIKHRMGDLVWIGQRDTGEEIILGPGHWILRILSLNLVQVLTPSQKEAL